MDATYNLNGGFKPNMKRFADLDGPDYFPTREEVGLSFGTGSGHFARVR
jgi:hypothetical protein